MLIFNAKLTQWDIFATFDLLPDKNILGVPSLFTRDPPTRLHN